MALAVWPQHDVWQWAAEAALTKAHDALNGDVHIPSEIPPESSHGGCEAEQRQEHQRVRRKIRFTSAATHFAFPFETITSIAVLALRGGGARAGVSVV